tara:strand:+ start:229 stop:840 length:612 start_codon:yes stop_codon:yes gene_type:complete
MTTEVFSLFPTPVFKKNISLDPNLVSYVKDIKDKELVNNVGNKLSSDNFILEQPKFKDIKTVFQNALEEYFTTIMGVSKVKPYITQSWLNYTYKGQYHHAHHHMNSYLSGVFYFNANKDYHSIHFLKVGYTAINPYDDDTIWNDWNAEEYRFPVETGTLLLFPSHLNHKVEQNPIDEVRISLSFNTFLKGTLKANNLLSFLQL